MAINTHGGGANTNYFGLQFEQDTSLNNALLNEGFFINGNEVYYEDELVGFSLPKYELYNHFDHIRGDLYSRYISKKLLPDEAFFNLRNNTLYIIEKKFQHSSGSVDEKLQTCDFKMWEYWKMFSPVGITVKYMYVLNDWFEQPMYNDVKQYIMEHGFFYYFNAIPLTEIGL